ncbi:Survival motor neuron protein [Frankliniella fusca]|uniref:Survival motor neuron protein n=1 Tax=Frankliniella fusca TaxID=407009 RepID=A0AAE1GWM5_9NEOP|nr:Survival motor neuron protein [Frankliniella fusca]
MSGERAPEVVLFARSRQDGDSTADDWDDTELLKEYDKAVRPLKALVAERMGLSNAEIQEASATESCASSAKEAREAYNRQHQKVRKMRMRKKNRLLKEWGVGDHCQAKFSADEKFYEATILSIDRDHMTCVVQYVGYGNSEEQQLDSLSHSMGAAVRRQQALIANFGRDSAEASQSDDILDQSSQASSNFSHSGDHSSIGRPKLNSPNKSGNSDHTFHRRVFQPPDFRNIPGHSFPNIPGHSFPNIPDFTSIPAMHDMVPPPLPPHILSGLPGDDSEALSAMLMSWYMSGFHTGYYQGLKRAKNFSPSHH